MRRVVTSGLDVSVLCDVRVQVHPAPSAARGHEDAHQGVHVLLLRTGRCPRITIGGAIIVIIIIIIITR